MYLVNLERRRYIYHPSIGTVAYQIYEYILYCSGSFTIPCSGSPGLSLQLIHRRFTDFRNDVTDMRDGPVVVIGVVEDWTGSYS